MCGIIGVFNHEQAAELAALGLFAEQHRGQESCGMAVTDSNSFVLHKDLGLVKNVFPPERLASMRGHIAVGHVRYPTRGSSTGNNSQPHVVETLAGPCYALASNGDVVNYDEVRAELEANGVWFKSHNDGELILKYIVWGIERLGLDIIEAIKRMFLRIKGAYSTVLATHTQMFLFRDPLAIRPMVYTQLANGAFAVASESCALDILNPEKIIEVEPAEIIQVNANGIKHHKNNPDDFRTTGRNSHCVFEHIYFSRPDSCEFGEQVYAVRERIGAALAQQETATADVVIPVPDSANSIALGYAKASGLPLEFGLIRNHYVGRTFIKPEQTVRDESVSQKFNTLPGFFTGKRVIMVDDSIVRGTTLRKLVNLVKKAGAAEIHLRIGSPMVKHSCFYGIDTPTKEELIANNMNLEEITNYLGVDSLTYISAESLATCVTNPGQYCFACFTGDYPLEV